MTGTENERTPCRADVGRVGTRVGTPQPDGRRRNDSGMALVSALLIMMVLSAMLVGFFAVIAADQQAAA